MTENGLYIQTVLTKRTENQADHVLLLGQVIERNKVSRFAFIKFLFLLTTQVLQKSQNLPEYIIYWRFFDSQSKPEMSIFGKNWIYYA